MGLFDIFKKKEVVKVEIPIKETVKSEQQTILATSIESIEYKSSIQSFIVIKGLRTDFEDSEIVDFVEHDEVNDEVKELVKTYVKSLTGQVFQNHKKFYKLQESPYKCKDKNKTQVWLYNLIDYDLQTVILRYNGKELIELVCKEMPELNTTDKEKLTLIAKEIKSN